jgi:hypothetical protein
MEYKFVTMGVFKELVSSGGIHEVVTQKGDNYRYRLFGLTERKDKAYLVKHFRGSNQAREWSDLGKLGNFIESAGIDKFTVIGLLAKE